MLWFLCISTTRSVSSDEAVNISLQEIEVATVKDYEDRVIEELAWHPEM